jgi:hypothetical protein
LLMRDSVILTISVIYPPSSPPPSPLPFFPLVLRPSPAFRTARKVPCHPPSIFHCHPSVAFRTGPGDLPGAWGRRLPPAEIASGEAAAAEFWVSFVSFLGGEDEVSVRME